VSVFFTNQDERAQAVFEHFRAFFVKALTDRLGTVRFAQVGARAGEAESGEGNWVTPILRTGKWRGVVVDPNPRALQRLRTDYGDGSGIFFHFGAADERFAKDTFYSVREPHAALSSFDLNAVLGHRSWVANIEELLEPITVQVERLDAICSRAGLHVIDALLIDAYGNDEQALRSVNLRDKRPRLIAFKHGRMSKSGSTRIRDILDREEYDWFCDAYNCLALHRGFFDPALVSLAQKVVVAAS